MTPKEGGRYLIHIMWWEPDVKATFKNGKFIPDDHVGDLSRHMPVEYVDILEELP